MRDNRVEIFKNLALITQIGLSIVVTIFVGILIGNTADKIFGTKIIFKIIFMILGAVAGFYNIYKIVIKNIERK